MNRLILIGNGFDLAHGMPTRYIDFLHWYVETSFLEAFVKSRYEDELIDIGVRNQYKNFNNSYYNSVEEFIRDACRNDLKGLLYNKEI